MSVGRDTDSNLVFFAGGTKHSQVVGDQPFCEGLA
jgi:hypothetical protein